MARLSTQDPLNTPRGFFKQACLQALLQGIGQDRDELRQHKAFLSLRNAMNEGLRFHDLTVVARTFGYAGDFSGTVRGVERDWGAVALRRLRLASGYPEKIRDVLFTLEEGDAEDTGRLIASRKKEGLSPEAIAQGIDGTPHTGFYRDLRLARAIVQIYGELETFGAHGEAPLRRALESAYAVFSTQADTTYSGDEWDRLFLNSLSGMVWLDRDRPPTPLFERLCRAQYSVEAELMDDDTFSHLVTTLGLPAETGIAFYDHDLRKIFFKRPSSVNLSIFSHYGRAYVHELRHAADFSESRYAKTREGTASAEGQAALTDELWRLLHVDRENLAISRHLGQGLVHFVLADYERPWLSAVGAPTF